MVFVAPQQGRQKRQKADKFGRQSALERLRGLKGSKNKWMDDTPSSIYDEVDEKEYSKIVQNRVSDWIVGDAGEGYVEDGREIFDDEDDYEDGVPEKNNKRKSNSKKKRIADEPASKKKGTLKNFFGNAEAKEAVSVEDDNLLQNLLGELGSNSATPAVAQTSSSASTSIAPKVMVKSIRRAANDSEIEMKNYMQKFGQKSKADSQNDDILNNLLKEEKREKLKQSKENQITKVKKEPREPTPEPQREVVKAPPIMVIKEELDLSVLDDDEGLTLNDLNDAEMTAVTETKDFKVPIVQPKEVLVPVVVNKSLSAKPLSVESTIFNELDGIDFESEIRDEIQGQVDLNTETMKFYYMDAWTDTNNRPGEVFLFGKVEVPPAPGSKAPATYNSICVRIENVNKFLYLLPRTHVYDLKTKKMTDKEVTIADVYGEFDDKITKDLNIASFNSRKVVRNFVFSIPDVQVPVECEYLEVCYAGKTPAPSITKEYATIAHIFGTNTSPIETLLLERKIKGPNWLEVKNFKVADTSFSWTKNQIICPDMNCISVVESSSGIKPLPPLVVATVNVKCVLNQSTNRNEIVMISCLVNDTYHMDRPDNQLLKRQFCGVTRPSNKNWPFDFQATLLKFKKFKVFKFDNERALLSWFLSIYQNIDPDIVVTFDSNDCQLDIICNRLTYLKIPMWSRIGRLRISQVPGKRVQEFFIGRMICDIKLSATELIKARSYDLGFLCKKILKIGEDDRQEILYDNIPFAYDGSSTIIEFIEFNVQDCLYIAKLMLELNILPLALQITTVCGNLMSRTLQGGRSERNEFLLMHAFHEKQYIVPDRMIWNPKEQILTADGDAGKGKKKPAYAGGLVLDPIKGFYETFVLLMDFNSLYPSIIQEYNICYTTIAPPTNPNELPTPPDSSADLGILPRQIRRLVESRKSVKKLMQTPNISAAQKMQYDIRQLALKLTANSMYGCLGFSKSRFYAPHLAALVTCRGRDILMATKTLTEKLNHSVIYGDTDSIMINTNSQDFDEVYKIGASIKQAVNRIYKHVELDIDGVYQKLLLLKKKKYAAVAVVQKTPGKLDYSYEFKGLDIVRRDWSKISSNTGRVVLDLLLANNGKDMDERIEQIFEVLGDLKKDLEEDKVPLPMLEITKQLTKAPKEYHDMGSLPHVQVADRMNIQKNRRFKKGDMIDYIICDDGTDNPAPKRGYHIDELKANVDGKLKPDKIYYITQQIHPVITRLLEPISGIDAAIIAEKLGLDPKDFKNKMNKKIEHDDKMEGETVMKTSAQKYKDCEKFHFNCPSCKSLNFIAAPFKRDNNNKLVSIFDKCSNEECTVAPLKYVSSIKNQLRAAIHRAISRFYENWYICDNPMCYHNTKNYAWPTGDGKLLCLACLEGSLTRVYTNTELNTQLSYYSFMFDLHTFDAEVFQVSPEIHAAYEMLFTAVEDYLEDANYFTVDLKKIFNEYDIQTKTKNGKSNENGKICWSQYFEDEGIEV
ncbi:unnamed protein product [Diamesa tonsa]